MNKFKYASIPQWLTPITAVLALFFLVILLLGIFGGSKKIQPGNTPVNGKPVPADVKILTVSKKQPEIGRLWPGVIRSRVVTNIAPKLTARIIDVKVNSGDRVKKGDILVQLDERELHSAYLEASAALTAAKALAAQAQADAKRSQELYVQEAVTRASYDAAIAKARNTQAAVKQAASVVERMKVNWGENILKAPFDSIVSERLKEPGDMGLPGQPIVTLLKPDNFRMEVALPQLCASQIQTGQIVWVQVESLPQMLEARIDEIVPEVDEQTGTLQIKAALPNIRGLRHGQFAWLQQSCGEPEKPTILIPNTAVLHYGQLEAVRVTAGQQVTIRHIRTGKRQGDEVEVLSGLHEGETIITKSGIAAEE